MSYKIKSFLYLVCFIASSVLYYGLEPEFGNKTSDKSAENIKLGTDSLETDNKLAELDQILE